MTITAKQFKSGYIYTKNGYTIYFKGGFYCFHALYDSDKFKTLKEVKEKIKSLNQNHYKLQIFSQKTVKNQINIITFTKTIRNYDTDNIIFNTVLHTMDII